MTSPINLDVPPAKPGIACILCGRLLSSTIEDPGNGDRHEVLVCGAHTDDDLSNCGLEALWAGADMRPGDFRLFSAARLVGAWELGHNGAHAVYLLLDNDELLIITPEYGGVAIVSVPRDKRLLQHPVGLPKHDSHPWKLAAEECANITSIRRRDDRCVDLTLADRGIVTFSTYYASWRELGDGKEFLAENWVPRF